MTKPWHTSAAFFIFFFFIHTIGFAQGQKLSPPQERSTLTILGSPNCPVAFRNSESSTEQAELFWGRIGYFDVNSKGEILVSVCKEDANAKPQCQNLFKGDIGDLCESEKHARQMNSAVRGAGSILGRVVPNLGFLTMALPNPNATRNTTTGEKIIELAIPGLAQAREISDADCTATLSLLQILRKELQCKDGQKQNADFYCEEKPESNCSFASAMEVFANTSNVHDRNQKLKEPSIQVHKNGNNYRVAFDPDQWYSKFLKNEENALAARRAEESARLQPAARRPPSPPPNRRPARN